MKILYAVQATGNGHISRAMEVLPWLEKYGSVDIFLSGANSTLPLNGHVKFRSKGLCFFYNAHGSLDYPKTIREFAPLRIAKEVRDLPVEKYDLVINDFDSLTAMACAFKKIPSVNFGHQASFQSDKTPRPVHKNRMGEWILKNFGRASQYVGLHFQPYDNFILPPVIKKKIILAEPVDRGYITIYLPSFSDAVLKKHLEQIPDIEFQVFSREAKQQQRAGNIHFYPVDNSSFTTSLVHCNGIITGAGFETPAEALFLQKKLMVIPIGGQYEQLCNSAALEQMGVRSIEKMDASFPIIFKNWINDAKPLSWSTDHSTESIISYLMHVCSNREKYGLDLLYPELVF